MKKHYLLLSIIFPVFIFGQNWSPIRVNNTMNYQHIDSTYITHSIWIDSAIFSGNDSVFFLNRVVKDVPGNPEIALRNQPQFLGEYVVKQEFGFYLIGDPYQFTLYAFAEMGDSWMFTSLSGISAEVTDISVEDLFGVSDSVKTISLTDGNEIRLSKSFGLLSYPDFENGGEFELVGIQNTEFGESVPDFWDIYNFEVGDVFQRKEHRSEITVVYNIIRKYTITAKEIWGNNITYEVEGIYNASITDWITIPPYYEHVEYAYTDELSFSDSSNHPANKFPGELFVVPESCSSTGSNHVYAKTRFIQEPDLLKPTKSFGLKYWSDLTGLLYYDLNPYSDTLYSYAVMGIIENPCFTKGMRFGETIGDIYFAEGCFEFDKTIFAQGYIKNGDTVGTITPDSLLMVGIDENKSVSGNVAVYPNPAHEQITFDFRKTSTRNSAALQIHDLCGKIIKKVNLVETSAYIFDLSDFKPGIFLFQIIENGEITGNGKFIVR